MICSSPALKIGSRLRPPPIPPWLLAGLVSIIGRNVDFPDYSVRPT
jgi:hypothetical protein